MCPEVARPNEIVRGTSTAFLYPSHHERGVIARTKRLGRQGAYATLLGHFGERRDEGFIGYRRRRLSRYCRLAFHPVHDCRTSEHSQSSAFQFRVRDIGRCPHLGS